MMQITNIRYHDNGSPQAALPDFIRRWNASDPEVRLRLGTHLRVLRPPARGARGTPAGDARRLDRLVEFRRPAAPPMRPARPAGPARPRRRNGLDAWHPTDEADAAGDSSTRRGASLALYAEHTWGADRSISQPYSPETRTQQILKLGLAPQGASLARMLRRDGLERLAIARRRRGADGSSFTIRTRSRSGARFACLILPPLAGAPEPQRGFGLEDLVPAGPSSHRIQRQDVVLSDLSDDRAYWSAPDRSAGALVRHYSGRRTCGPAPGRSAPRAAGFRTGALPSRSTRKRAACVRSSSTASNMPGRADGLRFGVPVLERAAARHPRGDLRPHRDRIRPTGTSPGTPTGRRIRESRQAVQDAARSSTAAGRRSARSFALPNGDRVAVTYRLVADEAALEIEVVVDKAPLAEPHAIYLPMPTALGDPMALRISRPAARRSELDDEQLPYASRGYITTQRWIRLIRRPARADRRLSRRAALAGRRLHLRPPSRSRRRASRASGRCCSPGSPTTTG